jgi:hypothetical protein
LICSSLAIHKLYNYWNNSVPSQKGTESGPLLISCRWLLELCWESVFQAQSVDHILLLTCPGPWSQWGHSDHEFVPWHPLLSPVGIRMFGPPSWPLCWLPTQCCKRSYGRLFDWSCTRLLVRLDHLV